MIEAELKRAAKDLFAELTDALRDADDAPEEYGLEAGWLERYGFDEAAAVAVVAPPPVPEQYERPKVKTRRVVRDADGRISEVIETEGYAPEPERYAAEADGDDKESDPDAVAELIAEILTHVYGDDAESHFDEAFGSEGEAAEHYARAWSAIDHPRGKGGRFIPKNSPEAHAAARNEVRRALKRKPTPEGLKALTEHLSILTTKQLHELKKEYGIAASGKDVAALREKIAQRLHTGRREPSVLDSPGKGSPPGAVLPADVKPHPRPVAPMVSTEQPQELPPHKPWSKPPLTGKGEEKPAALDADPKAYVHELLSGLGANPPEGQSRRSGNGMTLREVASLMPTADEAATRKALDELVASGKAARNEHGVYSATPAPKPPSAPPAAPAKPPPPSAPAADTQPGDPQSDAAHDAAIRAAASAWKPGDPIMTPDGPMVHRDADTQPGSSGAPPASAPAAPPVHHSPAGLENALRAAMGLENKEHLTPEDHARLDGLNAHIAAHHEALGPEATAGVYRNLGLAPPAPSPATFAEKDAAKKAAKLVKMGPGEYEYRGRLIYKTSEHSNAYDPWKISPGRSFATLAAAKKYLDDKAAL